MWIYAAYETLSDPDKRTEYDRGVLVADRRWRSFHSSGSSYSFYTGRRQLRKWVMDQCWYLTRCIKDRIIFDLAKQPLPISILFSLFLRQTY
ncbi:hypothetical protein ZIOFF_060240 [Zingiber officinale]|uniref:Uncharacterized protein n=1 Tax=Zingiber officinale TaxID=94328 RepID=A0A8J5FAI7_ZINOF|nr:hypothetical protein ZIOFF_060240 [Zingiber officinale]